jgi:hypothetical protein
MQPLGNHEQYPRDGSWKLEIGNWQEKNAEKQFVI